MASANVSDVLVVGGGPAGLAAAIACRQAGLGVTLVERSRPPLEKACGEGLMPDALESLALLGVQLGPAGRPFAGIRYLDEETAAEGRFPGGARGLGVRRTALSEALVRRAEAAGVELRWGEAVTALRPDGVETATGPLRARWVVAADGLRSRLRRWAGLEAGSRSNRPGPHRLGQDARFGVRRHFGIPPWSDLVEVHWGRNAEAYVTPVGPQEVGVAMLWSGEKARFGTLLERFPALGRRLDGAEPTSRDRGAGPFRQRVRSVVKANLALVGDASGYLDPLTGEGLALAFHQALALAEAIEKEDLGLYARAHRRAGRLPNALTGALLFAERRPALRRRLLRGLAGDPALFDRLLGIHARKLPPRELGAGGVVRLCRGLLLPREA